ncbi:MAG TPA: hypothetical protein VMT86_22410 [Bryobacteraceae bacterium]|nr:hypothetical protein [Bryobacteraceae bacterium]
MRPCQALFLLLACPAWAAISQPAQPSHYAESVGRRAALLGRQDGTFEAWVYPVKVLRDFRLAVYFDQSLEPLPLADVAERITSSPGQVTITHAHAGFTIRQTWVAALDEPAAVVLLDIDTARPLRLRATFVPEMRPMWPAAFGGQNSQFDEDAHALVLGEATGQHAAIIGSPLFVRASTQIGHQLPDRTVLMEMDVTPERARQPVPIVIVGSGLGSQDALRVYRRVLAELPRITEAPDRYYAEFLARVMHVDTPEPVLNEAFQAAEVALEKGWICVDKVGCGLVAGFGPSGASERPGFAWFFGGDALMNSWGILDYGDLLRTRALLTFVRDHQRADGKIMHELTQSAALLDWSKYPYGYFHADTTPLYLTSAAAYIYRSGDREFLRQSWASFEKAYRFCLTTLDADGLMSNRKAGAAAVETGALSGRVEKDVYLAGVWLAGLEGFARLASLAGEAALARTAGEELERGRSSLRSWFLDTKGFLPFARLTDGSSYEALSSWQAIAVDYGGLPQDKAMRAAAAFNNPELSTDWGTRLFATDSPFYDPLSYNDGSVWPFVTGFVTLAEFHHHRAMAALQHLYGVAALTGWLEPGDIPEYLSGDRAQALEHAVPHQLFSSSAVVHPLVSGLLGLDGDAIAGELRFAPHLPPFWAHTRFERYSVGESAVAGEVERQKGVLRLRLAIKGKPLALRIRPAFPPGTIVQSVTLNGEPAPLRAEDHGADVEAALDTGPVTGADILFRVAEGVEIMPGLRGCEPGDRSRSIRILHTRTGADQIEFELAGPASSTAHLQVWRGEAWRTQSTPEATIYFPPGPRQFTRARVVFRRVAP